MKAADVEKMTRQQLINLVYDLQAKIEVYEGEDVDLRIAGLMAVLKLSHTEAKMIIALQRGRFMRREDIYMLMYADRLDDGPSIKLLDVFVHKCRVKLSKFGIGIDAKNRVGIRLVGVNILNNILEKYAREVEEGYHEKKHQADRVSAMH